LTVDKEVRIYLVLSLVGLLMVLFLPFMGKAGELAQWQRYLLLVLFMACYALGLSMALRPNWWPGSRKEKDATADDDGRRPRFIGHHPDCPDFADHVVHIGDRTYCAGCLGLGLGCASSIPLSVIVLLILPPFEVAVAASLLVLGSALVALNLAESLHGSRYKTAHFLLNFFLPIAYLMIAAGVLAITGMFLNGLWVLVLGLLWTDSRKVLSQYHHQVICRDCPRPCKCF
jgi:hypothetical protein